MELSKLKFLIATACFILILSISFISASQLIQQIDRPTIFLTKDEDVNKIFDSDIKYVNVSRLKLKEHVNKTAKRLMRVLEENIAILKLMKNAIIIL